MPVKNIIPGQKINLEKLQRALPGILPKMSIDEALDVTCIYFVADQLPPETSLLRNRPFRTPHPTISHTGLVGGGNWPRPGEISLSRHAVPFLDELPEFGIPCWYRDYRT